MRIMPGAAALALAIGAAVTGVPVVAATWVVSAADPGGCFDGLLAGTVKRPLCSLQTAADRARAGDTIEVHGGVYGPATLTLKKSGTASGPIVIRSVPRRAAVLVGPEGAGESAGPAVLIDASHVVFEGFEVRDAAGTGIRNLGSFVTIRDNYVHHNARRCDPKRVGKCGQGIASNSSRRTPGVVIERNVSAYNGSGGRAEDHDYYLSGPGMIVRNNVAVGADDFGFQIYPHCDDCQVLNNVAYANGRSGFLFGGDRGHGVFSERVMISSNISMDNAQAGYAFYQPGGRSMTMRNNIAFGNKRGPLQVPEGYTGLDNAVLLEVDPMLVDPGALDFHLKAGSPAIDAGFDGAIPPDDIDGAARPDKAVDIGCDER